MTTLRHQRRLIQQESVLEGHWLNAWTEWGRAVLAIWKAVDPLAGERHDRHISPLYQEWVAAVQGGEVSTFLTRGASLTKWWDSAPLLWTWLWEVQQGWLEHDLRKWPNQLSLPPEVPEGVMERLVAEAHTAEDFALLLAVCSAGVRRG